LPNLREHLDQLVVLFLDIVTFPEQDERQKLVDRITSCIGLIVAMRDSRYRAKKCRVIASTNELVILYLLYSDFVKRFRLQVTSC